MQREIIFEVPENSEYRVVCRFGHDIVVKYNWTGHIEKRISYRRWGIFGKEKYKWTEVYMCWWDFDFEKMKDLRQSALNFFDEKILAPQRVIKKAMEI